MSCNPQKQVWLTQQTYGVVVDNISSTIKLNRTDASLNCSSGFMSIDLQFKQKFYGIVYAQLDRNSACKVSGNGEETAKIQIPLKGCGTEQVRKYCCY